MKICSEPKLFLLGYYIVHSNSFLVKVWLEIGQSLGVHLIDLIVEEENKHFLLKITPTRILMLSEYKGEFQHCFWSKCYGYIFLNLPVNKNLKVIPFILIPE